MKTVELADATASLSEYARKTRRETLVVTRKGKPLVAIMPVSERTDLENLVVTTHPKFLAVMERSQQRYDRDGGLSTDAVRDLLGVPKRKARRTR